MDETLATVSESAQTEAVKVQKKSKLLVHGR